MTVSASTTSYIVQGLEFTQDQLQGGIHIDELKAALAKAGIRGDDAAAVLALFRMWDRIDGTQDNVITAERLGSLDDHFMGFSIGEGNRVSREGLDAIQSVIKGDMFLRSNWTSNQGFVSSIFQLVARLDGVDDTLMTLKEFQAWLDGLSLTEGQKEALKEAFIKFDERPGGHKDYQISSTEFIAFMAQKGTQALFAPKGCKAVNGEIMLTKGQTYDGEDIKERKTKRYADKLFTTVSGGFYVNSNDFKILFEKGGPLSSITGKAREDLIAAFEKYCTTNNIANNKTGGMTREEFQKFWKLHAPE